MHYYLSLFLLTSCIHLSNFGEDLKFIITASLERLVKTPFIVKLRSLELHLVKNLQNYVGN